MLIQSDCLLYRRSCLMGIAASLFGPTPSTAFERSQRQSISICLRWRRGIEHQMYRWLERQRGRRRPV